MWLYNRKKVGTGHIFRRQKQQRIAGFLTGLVVLIRCLLEALKGNQAVFRTVRILKLKIRKFKIVERKS